MCAKVEVLRKYTCPAYWPRSDSRGVQFRNATLDIVYSVHSQELPTSPPSPTKLNLLFLHGGQFNKESWQMWSRLAFAGLGPEAIDKCIAMDHVHHGDSAVVNAGRVGFFQSWEDLGRDAGCVLRDCIARGEICRSAPVVVVAHSMSGTAAMSLDVFDPGLVAGLVMFDPVWIGDFAINDADQLSGTFARMSKAVYRGARDTFASLDEYHKFMDTKFLTARCHPEIRRDVKRSFYLIEENGTVRAKTSRALQAAPYYAGISAVGVGSSIVNRVRAPALIIHGSIADFNAPNSNEDLKEKLGPKTLVVTIPDADHIVPYTHPEATFAAAKPFLQEVLANRRQHYARVEEGWGPSADERFLKQVEAQAKGGPAGFSKL